jgi:Zn-dependent protease
MAVCLFSSWTWLQPDRFSVDGWVDSLDYEGGASPLVIVLSIVVVLISLSVHEASHAICAWWCGDDLARSLGRVTLNPKAHIDLFGTLLLPLILALAGAPVFGYARPVPVQLAGVRRFRRAHILISIAGPGSNLLLGTLALSVLLAVACLLRLVAPHSGLASCADLLSPAVHLSGFAGASAVAVLLTALKLTFLVNTFLAAFNLIPVPPLDGSWVVEHLLPDSLGRIVAVIRPYGFFIFLLLFWTHALYWFLLPAYIAMGMTAFLFAWCIGV